MFEEVPVAFDRTLYGSATLYDYSLTDVSTLFNPGRCGTRAMLLGLNHRGHTSLWRRAGAYSHGTHWDPTVEQGHAITFGANRSGKGASVIVPALMTYSGSMLVMDPKGENCWITAEQRRRMGQRTVLLDPWNAVNTKFGSQSGVTEKVTGFNPLAAINPRHPDFADDIAAVADALVVPDPHASPHWADSARELVAGCVAALIELKPGTASLGDLRKLVTAPDKALLEFIVSLVRERPNSLAARKLYRFTRGTDEISSVRSTAETQTAMLDSKTLCDAMESDPVPFDLAELATGRVTVYLVLTVDRLRDYGRWMRLLLSLAIRAIARQRSPPRLPVVFELDELGTISPGSGLKVVESSIGLMAGLGIRLANYFQDINQMTRDYPDSWQTFVANSSVIQVLNARDQNTSNFISDMLGTKTVIESNFPSGDGDYKPPDRHSRPVMFPEEVRRLLGNKKASRESLQLILFPALGASFKQCQNPYFEDARWSPYYRAIPGYQKASESPGRLFSFGRSSRNVVLAGAAGFGLYYGAALWTNYQNRESFHPERKPFGYTPNDSSQTADNAMRKNVRRRPAHKATHKAVATASSPSNRDTPLPAAPPLP